MIIFLAVRNLIRNGKNNLIIILLIMIITSLFFIGNTILTESNSGLKATYVRNFTGDIAIKMKSDFAMSIFGANAPAIGEFFSIPVLKQYNEILTILKECREVDMISSQVTGAAVVDVNNYRYNCVIFGVEPETYFPLFDGINVTRGTLIKPGERGAMITREYAQLIEKDSHKKLSVGDPILLSTIGRTGFKIREVPLTGIYTYEGVKVIPDTLVLTDPQTLRALNSILLGISPDDTPPEEATDILTDDPDSLFGEKGSPEEATDTLADDPDSLFGEEISPEEATDTLTDDPDSLFGEKRSPE